MGFSSGVSQMKKFVIIIQAVALAYESGGDLSSSFLGAVLPGKVRLLIDTHTLTLVK